MSGGEQKEELLAIPGGVTIAPPELEPCTLGRSASPSQPKTVLRIHSVGSKDPADMGSRIALKSCDDFFLCAEGEKKLICNRKKKLEEWSKLIPFGSSWLEEATTALGRKPTRIDTVMTQNERQVKYGVFESSGDSEKESAFPIKIRQELGIFKVKRCKDGTVSFTTKTGKLVTVGDDESIIQAEDRDGSLEKDADEETLDHEWAPQEQSRFTIIRHADKFVSLLAYNRKLVTVDVNHELSASGCCIGERERFQVVNLDASSEQVDYPSTWTISVSLEDIIVDVEKEQRNYKEYVRVVVGIGAFFFSTGLQWSFYINSTTGLEERKEICHHNQNCNMATADNLSWMGLNPDMVWSNAVYPVMAGLLMLISSFYHTRTVEDLGTDAPIWLQYLFRCGDCLGFWLIGHQKEKKEKDFGLSVGDFSGMYYFTGMAIFVEGGLSALYHTCPSKLFQQFDYIGITVCEIALFLLLWVKCHPKLPSAGSFAMYCAWLGMFSAIETSLDMENKKYAWIAFGIWILVVTPLVALTLEFGLTQFAGFSDLWVVLRIGWHDGLHLDRKASVYFGVILFLTLAYTLSKAANADDMYEQLAVIAFYLLVIAFGFVVIAVLACIGVRKESKDPLRTSETLTDPREILERKQKLWKQNKIGIFMLWIFFGLDHCVKGVMYPANNNMAHAIMQWHGKWAMLYYIYFMSGLFYFKTINWKRNPKFIRLLVYFFIMIGCGMAGGDYFVNGSYKANAQIISLGIDCMGDDGSKDSSKCAKGLPAFFGNYTILLDADYKCGERDERYICLVGSLDYNMGCSWVDNIDGHSLWHFFSGIALLVLPMSVMIVDDFLAEFPQREIAII